MKLVNRLTRKTIQKDEYIYEFPSEVCKGSTEVTCSKAPAIKKLAEIEDFEEYLGISLLTLLKALKNGFYTFDDEKIIFVDCPSITNWDLIGEIEISFDSIDGNYYSCKIKDYGKTWALTKQELEEV